MTIKSQWKICSTNLVGVSVFILPPAIAACARDESPCCGCCDETDPDAPFCAVLDCRFETKSASNQVAPLFVFDC